MEKPNTPPATFAELYDLIERLGLGTIEEDNFGQLVIYTGLQCNSDNSISEFLEEDSN